MTSFRLADPEWLILLAIIAPLLYLLRKSARMPALPHTDLAGVIERAGAGRRVRWVGYTRGLRLVALLLCLVALARPQWGYQAIQTHREGIAIAMAVDISSSMGAKDLMLDEQRSDRLAVVKHAFKTFVSGDQASLRGRAGDVIGLVTFARYSDLRSPPTLDHQTLIRLLEQINIVNLSEEDGTAIGDGIVAAIDSLRNVNNNSRVLILLTDGSNNAGQIAPMRAATIARALGVRIYAIGAGSRGTAMMPARKRGGGIEFRPTMVFIDDDALTRLAEHTGGRYFRATDGNALDAIYREIDRLEKGRNTSSSHQVYRDVFPELLYAALLLLILETLGRNTWLRLASE